MPRDSRSVAHWLRRAESDLEVARGPRRGRIEWENLCYPAQQAAEKAIKAVLISFGIDPPWTHQLDRLLRLLPPDASPPSEMDAVVDLTQYAMETRYPGREPPVTETEYREALRLAEAVLQWATATIAKAQGP